MKRSEKTTNRTLLISAALIIAAILSSCKKETEEDLTGVPLVTTETILTGFEIIWGMDFLPNGDLVFGEKRGKLYSKLWVAGLFHRG